ncbi:hypothetical protein GCM10023080_069210 [Streptomyces pseudoechinosporeus]
MGRGNVTVPGPSVTFFRDRYGGAGSWTHRRNSEAIKAGTGRWGLNRSHPQPLCPKLKRRAPSPASEDWEAGLNPPTLPAS